MDYPLMQWKPEYATGNDGIDYQHKGLITTVNDLIGAYNSSNGEPNALLIEVPVDELFKFAAHHFASEEAIMKSHHYHLLTDHHELHVQFVLTLIQIKVRLDKDENVTKDLIDYMEKWFKEHISVEDKAAMQVCR